MVLLFCVLLYAVVIFILQRILFSKTDKKFLQCIPLYIIAFVYLFSIGCILYDTLGFSHHDGFLFYTFIAWLLIGANTAALLADCVAWLFEKV